MIIAGEPATEESASKSVPLTGLQVVSFFYTYNPCALEHSILKATGGSSASTRSGSES